MMQREVSVHTILITFKDGEFYISPTERFFPNFSLQHTMKAISSQYSLSDMYFELLTVAEDRTMIRLFYIALVRYDDLKHEYIRIRPVAGYKEIDGQQSFALKRVKRAIKSFNPHYITKLLRDEFPIEDLFVLYNAATNENMDKGNFHKMIKNKELVEETGNVAKNVGYRPPRLFTMKVE